MIVSTRAAEALSGPEEASGSRALGAGTPNPVAGGTSRSPTMTYGRGDALSVVAWPVRTAWKSDPSREKEY